MTVELAELAVKCAEAQLETAREILIDAIITEAGGNPNNVETVTLGGLVKGLTGRKAPKRTSFVDPLAVFGAVERF